MLLSHFVLSTTETLILAMVGGASTVLAAYLPARLAFNERRYDDLVERVAELEQGQNWLKGFVSGVLSPEADSDRSDSPESSEDED